MTPEQIIGRNILLAVRNSIVSKVEKTAFIRSLIFAFPIADIIFFDALNNMIHDQE
jgi:hypothetical protein